MPKSREMERRLNQLSLLTFGRSRSAPACVCCGSPKILDADYRDELSIRERNISRLCQKCQDDVFVEEKE